MEQLLSILLIALDACLVMLFIILIGYWLSTSGILTDETSKTMNYVLNNVFIPALLFVSIGNSFSVRQLYDQWLLIVIMCVYLCLHICVAYIIARYILGYDIDTTRYIISVTAFNNTTAVPLAIAESLVPLLIENNVLQTSNVYTAETMIILFAIISNVPFWSIAPTLLKPSSPAAGTSTDDTLPLIPKQAHSTSQRLNRIFSNVPLLTAVITMVISSIPQIRGLFFVNTDTQMVVNEPPLYSFTEAMTMLGTPQWPGGDITCRTRYGTDCVLVDGSGGVQENQAGKYTWTKSSNNRHVIKNDYRSGHQYDGDMDTQEHNGWTVTCPYR